MSAEIVIALLAATVQSGTPILFATLGEIFSEKSGCCPADASVWNWAATRV